MRRAVIAALGLFILAGAAAWGQLPPEPSGYRMKDYRGLTPATLTGARVVTTVEAAALWKAGAAFVDVLPHAPRPNLPAGTIWHENPRVDIPGSIWLPDTGYGALAAATQKYLLDGLAKVTGGDRTRWLVVYCMKNCWMSWNAAKRALSVGYKNVAWYPDGTDGWQAATLPVQKAEPAPANAE
jgi:PQQ-dependent catabolism-associated CXXCW motif protein